MAKDAKEKKDDLNPDHAGGAVFDDSVAVSKNIKVSSYSGHVLKKEKKSKQ